MVAVAPHLLMSHWCRHSTMMQVRMGWQFGARRRDFSTVSGPSRNDGHVAGLGPAN